MKSAQIVGVGHDLPGRVVDNHELEKYMDTSDEWIRERTGIVSRHWIQEGDSIRGMAYRATQMALERAGMKERDIEMIVFASVISDHVFPGAGCYLGAMMGIPGAPAYDIRNACSGFIYALALADKFIQTGTYKNVLVVGSEIQSTSLDLSTRGRDMAVIFADGAGAAVLTATDDPAKGILTTHIHADGRYADKLWCEAPCAYDQPRLSPQLLESNRHYPHMEGRYVFKHAVTKFPEAVQEALEATGHSIEDLDLLIPHQANLRITEAVGQRLGLPPEKVYSNIQWCGNTTAASIPIAMSEVWEKGLIREGALVCLAAFGGGFTWGSALVRF